MCDNGSVWSLLLSTVYVLKAGNLTTANVELVKSERKGLQGAKGQGAITCSLSKHSEFFSFPSMSF